MATYTTILGGFNPEAFFSTEIADATGDATSVTYTLVDGRQVVVTGTGLAIDATNAPIAGTITRVELRGAGGSAIATFDGLSGISFEAFYAAWKTDTPNEAEDIYQTLLPGSDTAIGTVHSDVLYTGSG